MPKCSIYSKCGGCSFPHDNYDATIEYKKNYVIDAFKKEKLDVYLDKVITTSNPFGYRNKMQLAFGNNKGKTSFGFYEENSHKVVDLDYCLVHTKLQNDIAFYIREIVEKLRLKPYDEDRKIGLLRHILIKESFSKNQVMVVIVTSTDIFPGRNDFVKLLRAKFPVVSTVIHNVNPRKTSIILGDKERILFGKGFIEDELCGLNFKIASKTFYQVNPEITNKMYNTVLEYASLSKNDVVLDSYSGVGTIGMILSKQAKEVISVESNSQSVKAAIINAKNNNIKNVKFVCEDATKFIADLAKENYKLDVLIMDPPRSGSTEEFLNNVNKLLPKKVVYVSCDPLTLVRDLKILMRKYKIVKTSLFDMFCWTKHVESCVLLERR